MFEDISKISFNKVEKHGIHKEFQENGNLIKKTLKEWNAKLNDKIPFVCISILNQK